MSESSFKLTYFDTKGRAESIRYIFAYADVEFEDNRVDGKDWGEMKDSTPFGSLPILEVDGNVLSQTVAISRYLGKRFNLIPDDPFKEALLESVVDALKDVQSKLGKKNPCARQEGTNAMSYTYSRLETLAADGYFLGSEPSWVDVYFAGMLENSMFYTSDCLDPYPNLGGLVNNIRTKDSLKNYLENRPEN